MAMTGKIRIMIYGPKNDGTYVIEFRMADGESLAISVPAGETRVLKHFQTRMPYGPSCRTFREEHSLRPGVFADGVLPTPLVRVPETPPEPPFGLRQSGGVLVCETSPPKSFRRSNGGDWTEGLTRNRLERSPLRRHYFMLALFLQTQREVNDETCSDRRKRG